MRERIIGEICELLKKLDTTTLIAVKNVLERLT